MLLILIFLPKQSTVGFSFRKKNWPRPRSLSAMCPLVSACPLWPRLQTLSPYVRLVSALCPPWFRFGRVSKLCPHRVRHVSAFALSLLWPRLQISSAIRPLVSVLCVFTMCSPCARSLAAQVHHVSSPLDFVRSWHHEVKSFRSIVQPTVLIWHARSSVSLASLAVIWGPQFGLCKRTLCLKNCLGFMLVKCNGTGDR